MVFGNSLSQRSERIHNIGNSRRDSKDDGGIKVWTWAISRQDHLHVNVQRHCMRIMLANSCPDIGHILVTWIREEMVRNLFWQMERRLGQNCRNNDAQSTLPPAPWERRELKSEPNRKSFHYNGSEEYIELILRTIISVNQLSVYGSVADLCKELSDDSEVAGNYLLLILTTTRSRRENLLQDNEA